MMKKDDKVKIPSLMLGYRLGVFEGYQTTGLFNGNLHAVIRLDSNKVELIHHTRIEVISNNEYKTLKQELQEDAFQFNVLNFSFSICIICSLILIFSNHFELWEFFVADPTGVIKYFEYLKPTVDTTFFKAVYYNFYVVVFIILPYFIVSTVIASTPICLLLLMFLSKNWKEVK